MLNRLGNGLYKLHTVLGQQTVNGMTFGGEIISFDPKLLSLQRDLKGVSLNRKKRMF